MFHLDAFLSVLFVFIGGELTQLGEVERVEIAKQRQESDLGTRVDLTVGAELVHNWLEAKQTLDCLLRSGRVDAVRRGGVVEPLIQLLLSRNYCARVEIQILFAGAHETADTSDEQ